MKPARSSMPSNSKNISSHLALRFIVAYRDLIMEPKPHMRKIEVSLSDAEDLTLESLKRMHPDLVRKNGDCPDCVVLQHQMADTTRHESVADAMEVAENEITLSS